MYRECNHLPNNNPVTGLEELENTSKQKIEKGANIRINFQTLSYFYISIAINKLILIRDDIFTSKCSYSKLAHNIYLVRNDLCIYIDILVSNVKNVFIPVVSSQSILSDQNMEASILDRNFC